MANSHGQCEPRTDPIYEVRFRQVAGREPYNNINCLVCLWLGEHVSVSLNEFDQG